MEAAQELAQSVACARSLCPDGRTPELAAWGRARGQRRLAAKMATLRDHRTEEEGIERLAKGQFKARSRASEDFVWRRPPMAD